MIKRIAGWIVLVPLSLVLIVFALANRQLVVVNFNPMMPSDALSSPGFGVPLFLVVYAVLLCGVVLGGVAAWFAASRSRQERRHWRREADRLGRELQATRANQPIDDRLIAGPGLGGT